MKAQLKKILAADHAFNAGDMAAEIFGFRRNVHYDALVVAPGWKPSKILNWTDFTVTQTAEHSYTSGYEVQIGDKLVAWAQTGSGGCNLIDHMILCAGLDFDHLIFAGAVGGLKKDFEVGDVCVSVRSIAGTMANAYLTDDIPSWRPFVEVFPPDMDYIDQIISLADFPVKKASVYCTDSISCEYYHLDFIRSFGTDLIEMETSSFYALAQLMERPAAAILVVSDNSANGEPLIGKSDAQEDRYNQGRKVRFPRLLERIVCCHR